jgi:hypothetical protein
VRYLLAPHSFAIFDLGPGDTGEVDSIRPLMILPAKEAAGAARLQYLATPLTLKLIQTSIVSQLVRFVLVLADDWLANVQSSFSLLLLSFGAEYVSAACSAFYF